MVLSEKFYTGLVIPEFSPLYRKIIYAFMFKRTAEMAERNPALFG